MITILVCDHEDASAEILVSALRDRGYANVRRISSSDDPGPEAPPTDVLVVNHHSQNPAGLGEVAGLKSRLPDAAVIAVVSAGPVMRSMREWNRENKVIDAIIEKPLSDERFFSVLDDLATARRAAREQQLLLDQLSRLVPAPALTAIRQDPGQSSRLFEAAIVFTDIRRSTRQITSLRPADYFEQLNSVLSAQTRILEQHEGVLVKYTGDGLLAMFCGLGRSRLALAAATALAADNPRHRLNYGIGIAQGLVLAGFVGDPHVGNLRRQYDVVGATVHLAARLCNLAPAGEIYAQRSMLARWHDVPHVDIGPVTIRGFDQPINCVGVRPANPETIQS
ncbi:MAG: adenylate/guanylate cyclase domain-containing protein [Opitutaceae bacterium]|nr:adenylate/guanylate cyclase domain-containing protein [Opitutaceae bacterium]